MRKLIILFLILIIVFTVPGCNIVSNGNPEGINIVTTIFPPYDFVREIAGDKVNITLLLPPGTESHSYEPTPQDIIKIENCDLFIYNGGKSESWVNTVLESMKSDINTLAMMDNVTVVEEKIVEGMKADDGVNNETEYDEHIWTSPKNSQKIVSAISDVLCKIDPDNRDIYTANTAAYIGRLTVLDNEFRSLAQNAAYKTLIFGDRFPFRYFADEYSFNYYAAFPGCNTETEPSAASLAFLIDKVKAEKVSTVFYIEYSNHLIADSISEATGAKTALLHSCHTVSKDDIDAGASYISLMEQNLNTLKVALG